MQTPVFAGLLDGKKTNFVHAQAVNAAQAKRRAEFRRAMAALKGGEALASKEVLAKFAFEDNKPKDFQAAELMEIFVGFRKKKAWPEMLRLVEESETPEFSKAPIVQEFCAVVCNQLKQYDRTLEICKDLLFRGFINGEVYGAMGKAYLQLGDIKRSERYYQAGFLHSFEYYPGINAAYRQLDLGNFEKAKSLTRMVRKACLRDGVRETMDYWCAVTLIEAATIMDDGKAAIDDAVKRLESMQIEGMQIESTIETLKGRQENLRKMGQDTSSFDYTIAKLSSMEARKAFKTAAQDASQSVLKNSYGNRDLASNFVGQHFVSGNIKYKGQLPDHSLSRTDWSQFERLLDLPIKNIPELSGDDSLPDMLSDITDVDEFLSCADKIIRNAFGTDRRELEYMLSPGHAKYDQTVHALFKLSGVRENALDLNLIDSRTSISVIMALGLGDCRHHAQVKQILFDAWQKRQMNHHLRDAYTALEKGDEVAFEKAEAAFDEVESMELRTFDVEIDVPVKCDQSGFPVIDENGHMILDRGNDKREPHTMTILLRKDKDHKVVGGRFADAFYQEHYLFGDGEIDMSAVTVDENGSFKIPAKTVKVADPDTGEIIEVPVTLKPAAYAGKREQEANDEYGQLLMFGIPVHRDFDLCEHLTKTYEQRTEDLDAMCQWSEDDNDIPELLLRRNAVYAANTAKAAAQLRPGC